LKDITKGRDKILTLFDSTHLHRDYDNTDIAILNDL